VTSVFSTTFLGPVRGQVYNAGPSWASDSSLLRSATFAGHLTVAGAEQMSELLANTARRVTIGGHTGVLEFVWSESGVVNNFNGWYLLEQFSFEPYRIGDSTTYVAFTLDATYLGSQRQPVVTRAARAKPNDFALSATSVLVNPLWDEASSPTDSFVTRPVGSFGTREYDASFPYVTPDAAGTSRGLGFYTGPVTATEDLMEPVALAGPGIDGSTLPKWLTDRGGDVRAFDRRQAREVYGPSHPFAKASDLMVNNGLVRFWSCPLGMIPFLHVQAYRNAAWRDVGYVVFSSSESQSLTAIRLAALTPESATVVLVVQGLGEVSVSLRRGERMLRVQHGSDRFPLVTAERMVEWRGIPPARYLPSALANGTGKFSNGLSYSSDGVLQVQWPPVQPNTAWTVAGWWLPASASTALATSSLFQIADATGQASILQFNTTGDKLQWIQGADTLETGLLSFSAGQAVFFCCRFNAATGRTLTTKVHTGAVSHVSNAFTGTGTTATNYDSLIIGASATQFWGSGTWGSGTWGGSDTYAGGVIDNLMLFDSWLTDSEAAALAGASSGLNALPAPEGRLILFVPFDPTPSPKGSALANGQRYEATAENGATRSADANGLTKALVTLNRTVGSRPGLGMRQTTSRLELAAVLATATAGDDIADHQAQYAAENFQELRVR
jgi:hypothetical protein